MKFSYYILIGLSLMLLNCSSDDTNDALIQCELSQCYYSTFDYDLQGRLLRQHSELQENDDYTYSYQKNEIIVKYTNSSIVKYRYKLDSIGNIIERGYDTGSSVIEFVDKYEYDANGRLIKHIDTRFPDEEVFTYNSSGNIVNINYGNVNYALEYDDKPNPLHTKALTDVWPSVTGIHYQTLSKNNITKVKKMDASSILDPIEDTFLYTFNDHGLPLYLNVTTTDNNTFYVTVEYNYLCN